MRILLQSGTIINEGRIFKGDLLIHNDRIEKIIEGKLGFSPRRPQNYRCHGEIHHTGSD